MNRFKNFSESGSKTITAAVNVAGRMGHITVGSEHLLMGILASGRSDASELLTEYDINFQYQRSTGAEKCLLYGISRRQICGRGKRNTAQCCIADKLYGLSDFIYSNQKQSRFF